MEDDVYLKANSAEAKARDRKGVLAISIGLTLGVVFWVSAVLLEWQFKDTSVAAPLPHCVHTSYALCAAAYATSALLVVPKIVFDTDPTHYRLHLASLYVSSLACGTYTLLALDIPISQHDMNSIIFIPIRWSLYFATVPAIWWILAHGSHYTLRRKLYVQFLMIVTLAAGGIATLPSLRWGHKMYWMTLACVPFPEICFHLWAMLTDAINTLDADSPTPRSLYFLRIYSLFSFQAFPAIYFAAFDGVLPLAASESIWALSDWALKMVITSSLMEINFMTIEQRRDWARRRQKDRARMRNILSLTSAIEAKDNFLATVSHELCTPLNGIIGLSYALQASQEVQAKTELSKTLSVVTMSGKRLLQLIYDVLDAAKTTDDTPMIKHESVNVRALVLDVAMVCSGIVRQGVDLRVQLQPVPRIIGDTGRIVQILHNLVGNSCKFTKSGHVLIGVRYDSALRAIALSVSDTGCGIPSEALHSVFDAFSQGLHRASEGLGLGLHLVVEFVKAHHGLIEVESEVGKGSTFTVWLPVHPDKRLLRTALKHPEQMMQDLVGGTVVIRNSPDGSGVRSRLVLTSQPVEQRNRSLRAAPISSSPRAAMAFLEADSGSGVRSSQASAEDTGATHDGRVVVPAATTHEANCLPSDAPPPALVTPGYHGEVHGVPLVFVVGSEQCDHLIDYLCAEGYMVEVQTSGERAVDRMLNSPLLPDAMIVFSAVHGTDGISFCLQTRELFPLCAFPIIYLSPHVGLDVLREALNAGCMDVMQWPGVNQELVLRLRSQIAMHSNKREALHRGPHTLRPYKLQLLPYFLRHRIAIASANDTFLNESNPAITYSCNHTAVMHLCIDNVWRPKSVQPKQGSLINEVHSTIHNLLKHTAVCSVPASPDGWTFVSDPDTSMQDVGINQFVAEVVMHMERLAIKHSCTLNPRVGVAFGPVQMSVASATSEASFLAVGAVLTLAAAVAAAAPPGTIAFVHSDALKAVSPATGTVPMTITIAGGKQAQVQVQIMPPHNAYTHCFLGGEALRGLSRLHRVFSSLDAARLAVHRCRRGNCLAESQGASPPSASEATGTEPLQPRTSAEGGRAAEANGAASGGEAAPADSQQQLSQPVLDALERATARRTEANVPSHILMHEPSLSSVAQCANVRLPDSLTGAPSPPVSVMAFLEAADMPLFALPDAEGVRLLTSCKRAFTDMMLGALNQILAKPCVRE